jgi:hypothetical protein
MENGEWGMENCETGGEALNPGFFLSVSWRIQKNILPSPR